MGRTTAIRDSIDALKKRLLELDREQHKVRAALAALSAVDNGEVVVRAGKNGQPGEMAMKAPGRSYSYKYTAKCHRCGKEFKTARLMKGAKRNLQFCHNPCTSSKWRDEQAQKAIKLANSEKLRGVTLMKGDGLSTHH